MESVNVPVASWLNHAPLQGILFGVEVECEGEILPIRLGKYWKSEQDGSLRGNALEYVLTKPLPYLDTMTSIDFLWKAFEKNGTILKPSNRTSVHVHVNMSDRNFGDVFKVVALHTVFETLLLNYCGPERKGNLFCLRARDATFMNFQIKNFIKNNGIGNVFGDNVRYSACNLAALSKYGSLEFRAMRGTKDPEVVKTWVGILNHLVDQALNKFLKPSEIVFALSAKGPVQFAKEVLGDKYFDIVTTGMEHDDIYKSMYEGIRIIQDYVFDGKWEDYKPHVYVPPIVKAKPEPKADKEWGVIIDDFEPLPNEAEVVRQQAERIKAKAREAEELQRLVAKQRELAERGERIFRVDINEGLRGRIQGNQFAQWANAVRVQNEDGEDL